MMARDDCDVIINGMNDDANTAQTIVPTTVAPSDDWVSERVYLLTVIGDPAPDMRYHDVDRLAALTA
jgi:hypothetical protein